MKQTSTQEWVPLKKCLVLLLTFVGLFLGQTVYAHTVNGYTSDCNAGPSFSITPVVANVNSSSNYGWQYKNSAGNWVCIVNGTNVINGVSFNVTGASSTMTTNPSPLVFTNPSSDLNGLVVRCIISDGAGVNPCSMPSGNTYNSGSTSTNITISVAGTSCGNNRFCPGCALGYPDNSNLPRSGVVFNENDVLRAFSPDSTTCGQASGSIKAWYNDEHALTLGIRRVIVKRANGTTYTTDYPITAYGGTPTCVTNPQVGSTIASGAQSGNDVAAGGGRPMWPALFITDLTVNGPTSRIGDWQQGGTGIKPTSVCGSWKGAVKTVDSTFNPPKITITCDADPAKNNWNLGGGEAPPSTSGDEGYGALVKWDLSTLNLVPGHDYRLQIMVHDGDQNKVGGDAGSGCTRLIGTPEMYPDFNVTYVNVPVPGNVSTNDVVPSTTTWGSPTLISSPAGSSPSITMNSDGTYTFVSNVVGVYKYNVNVCVPGASPCPKTLLTITVLGPTINNNPPVANTDIAQTKVNTPVTLNSLANDRAGNPGGSLVPSSVTVTVNPLHGTVTVNSANGNTTYTPAANYVGNDTLTYRVCDNSNPSLCATALQIISIKASGVGNSTLAADDYAYTPINTAVSGNVKTNDTDPEGNAQTVTAQTTTSAGKGTLVLATDGSFTFTPVNGYTGPVNFPYTTTDNGVPAASAKATLYILVSPELPLTNPDFNTTFVNVHVPGDVSTNDKVPAGSTYGTTPTLVGSPAGSTATIVMNSNGTYDFVANKIGLYTYDVPVCVPGATAPCPPTKLYITVLDKNIDPNAPVANVDVAYTKVNTPVTLKSLANDHAGSVYTALVPSSVTITANPHNGTATVNTATGDITYTPANGFTGRDTLTYSVCDNQSPAKCASANQIITVKGNNALNSTDAADDYNIISVNTIGTGNVKINDTDPEGNTQTVTTQTTTVAGKGTLILQANGDYQFVPVTNFVGPVDFPYTTTDNGTPVASAKATLHILVIPEAPTTNPDFNTTFVNVHVPGDVSTNDRVPAGSTYGTTPTLVSGPGGSHPVIVMNSNGTYDFVSDMIGVYTYDVPVCVPGAVAPCPPTKLYITVLDATSNSNAPVANVDVAYTRVNIPVTLRSLVNDHAGSAATALVPSSVTVVANPHHGTATVNTATGDITYTPAAGFTGRDTLTYSVCDNQVPAKCATANQIITVRGINTSNTTDAADDYNIIPVNTVGTGNVKVNDTDPEGNTQTVTAQNTTVAGKGTLVLQSNGDYQFTPVVNFTGPVDFPYTTTDNGTPVATAKATLHILVAPNAALPDLTPSIFNDGTTVFQQSTRDNVIRIFNIGAGATTAPVTFTIPKMEPAYQITINPGETTMDVFGGMTVNNADWTIVEQATRFVLTSKPGVVIPAGGYADIGVKVKAVGIKNSTGNLSVQIVFGTGGGETPFNNNADNNTYSTN